MGHNVSSEVTEGLRRRGVDVLTAAEDRAARLGYADLLARATSLDRVLFTHDRDFLRISAAWQRQRIRFAGVVFIPQLAANVGRCISDLELIARGYDPVDLENRLEYPPLRR